MANGGEGKSSMIDIKIVGGVLLSVIVGVAAYLYGKSKCHKRHPHGPPGAPYGMAHPHMFRSRRKED